MLLLVGLGNPGPEYARNRHNVGFMAVDEIVRRHSFSAWRARFHGELAEGQIAGRRCLALKPHTYMNRSGTAVQAARQFYKLDPGAIVVFHDEIELAPGKLRVKRGGGHAGHNGLRDIDAHVGPDYRRVRIGVGHPGEKDRVSGHVLHDFAKADDQWLTPLLEAMANAADFIARDDDAAFTNAVALALQPERPPPRPTARGAGPA